MIFLFHRMFKHSRGTHKSAAVYGKIERFQQCNNQIGKCEAFCAFTSAPWKQIDEVSGNLSLSVISVHCSIQDNRLTVSK